MVLTLLLRLSATQSGRHTEGSRVTQMALSRNRLQVPAPPRLRKTCPARLAAPVCALPTLVCCRPTRLCKQVLALRSGMREGPVRSPRRPPTSDAPAHATC